MSAEPSLLFQTPIESSISMGVCRYIQRFGLQHDGEANAHHTSPPNSVSSPADSQCEMLSASGSSTLKRLSLDGMGFTSEEPAMVIRLGDVMHAQLAVFYNILFVLFKNID